MINSDNLSDVNSDVNIKIEKDMELAKIRKEVFDKLKEYQKTMTYMVADAPIAVLCLPKTIERKLLADSCLRVYDLLDRDLTEIEGLDDVSIGDLTSRLNQFFSMS